MTRRAIDRQLVRELYGQYKNCAEVHRILNERGIACVYGTVLRLVNGKKDGHTRSRSRFAAPSITETVARMPSITTKALFDKTTIYPHTVVHDLEGHNLLKSGLTLSKVGQEVVKGRWSGMPIFTLTLEERATCPTECRHWRSCYGNSSNFAVRISHEAPDFEARLVREVAALAQKYRTTGFVVRLHILGDFFSVRYVRLWRSMIETIPQLHVYGYTARHDAEIGGALRDMVRDHWDRFSMRFSNAPDAATEPFTEGVPATLSLEHPIQNPPDTTICPNQWTPSGKKAANCGTCGLCWQTKRRISFLQH